MPDGNNLIVYPEGYHLPSIAIDDFKRPLFRRDTCQPLLIWDRNGFGLYYKVVESKDRFFWPRLRAEDVVTLSAQQMNWLLDGYDVWAAPHRMIRFDHVS